MNKSPNQLSNPQNSTRIDPSHHKLFIGGLPPNTIAEDIKSILSKKTQIFEIVLKLRANSNKCIGHGYVTTSKEGAEKLLAIESFDYDKRKVKIAPYRDGSRLKKYRKELSRRRIFIKNLPVGVKVEQISGYFKRYGPIESCYLRGEPRSHLRIAVLIFNKKISALKVQEDYRFQELNFEEILGVDLSKPVYVGFQFFMPQKQIGVENHQEGFESNESSRSTLDHRFVEMFSRKPGQMGFDYTTDNLENYVFCFEGQLVKEDYQLVTYDAINSGYIETLGMLDGIFSSDKKEKIDSGYH